MRFICPTCGREFTGPPSRARRAAHPTCSVECKTESKLFRETQSAKTTEVMGSADHRARLSAIHRTPATQELHRQAVTRGPVPGWFRATPEARAALAFLPEGWVLEFPVSDGTGARVAILDLAEPKLRRALEVDGRGHAVETIRRHDAARDQRLRSLGWDVRRITNQEALDGAVPQEWREA